MNELLEVVEISDGCGGFYYVMEPVKTNDSEEVR